MITSEPSGASEEQRAAIEWDGGHAYVDAGPGTGKTFLLVERYKALRARGVRPDHILVLTFSRRSVGELRERLVATGTAPSDLDVRTFHGFAARVLGGGVARFRTRRLLDGFSRELMFDAALASTPTPAVGAAARESRVFRNDVARLIADLERAPFSVLGALGSAASPRLRDVLALQGRCAALRDRAGASDIGELVGRALDAVREPGTPAARWLEGRYAHVLIDEFQDTDRVQLALLREIGATLFAVGDEAQAIYRFRGASDGIVDAAVSSLGMRRFGLTVSRRCPPDVCALAAETPLVGAGAPRSLAQSGSAVEVVRLRALDDEVVYVADRIEAELEAGVAPEEVAVLLRSTRPFAPLLLAELRRRAVPVAESGREGLLADPRVIALRSGLEVLDDPSRPDRWLRLLTAPPLGFDALALRLARARVGDLRLDATLPAALAALNVPGNLPAEALAEALLSAAEAWRAGDLGSAARRLARRAGLLAAVLRDEEPTAVRAAATRLRLVCGALAAAQRTVLAVGAPATCRELLARFEDALPTLSLDEAGSDPAARGVRILTVHAAKGLEFERVMIVDAVDGRFPQAPRPSSLLNASDRALLAAHDIDGSFVSPEAAEREEASLWYVAATRSKDRLLVTYAERALDGGVQRPSRFLAEQRLPEATTAVSRESALFAALRSGDPVLRERLLESGALVASPALTAFAQEGSAAFAPLPPRPLRRAKPLSVGDLETWLRCPRRLYYKGFARVPSEDSPVLALGSAIHDVLRRFHETERDFTTPRDGAAVWTDALLALRRASWDPSQYESSVLAEAAARAADTALRAYAAALEAYARTAPFTVEACEHAVEVPIGPARIAGRADRIDRLADGTRVLIDYKRGAAKKTDFEKTLNSVAQQYAQAAEADVPFSLGGAAPDTLAMQLALYASALTDVGAFAYVYLSGPSKPQDRATKAALDRTVLGDETRAAIATVVDDLARNLVAPLAEGTLTALPVARSEDPCTFCPYANICPGGEESIA